MKNLENNIQEEIETLKTIISLKNLLRERFEADGYTKETTELILDSMFGNPEKGMPPAIHIMEKYIQ